MIVLYIEAPAWKCFVSFIVSNSFVVGAYLRSNFILQMIWYFQKNRVRTTGAEITSFGWRAPLPTSTNKLLLCSLSAVFGKFFRYLFPYKKFWFVLTVGETQIKNLNMYLLFPFMEETDIYLNQRYVWKWNLAHLSLYEIFNQEITI